MANSKSYGYSEVMIYLKSLFCLLLLINNLPAEAQNLNGADIAKLFAEGIVSTGNENDELFPAFTPDGKTIYFVRRIPDGQFTIYFSNWEQGKWSQPEMASFSGNYDDQEPYLSPDGNRLYFTSNRPFEKGGEPIAGRDIWYVERNGNEWGVPKHIGAPVSLPPPTDESVSRFFGLARGPMIHPDGTLYFWAERPDNNYGATDIYRSELKGENFERPVNLGPAVNGEHYETTMVVSFDKRYMFLARDGYEGGPGRADIYISYNRNGKWIAPENCGSIINSDQFDFSPRLHPDGEYLFFSSNRNAEGEGMGRQNIYYIRLSALPCFKEDKVE